MHEQFLKRERAAIPAPAADGGVVQEFFGARDDFALTGIATGYLPAGRKAVPHFHRECDEIYIVTGGAGWVHLGSEVHAIAKGDQIYIPRLVVHALESADSGPLEIICVSTPPFREGDFLVW